MKDSRNFMSIAEVEGYRITKYARILNLLIHDTFIKGIEPEDFRYKGLQGMSLDVYPIANPVRGCAMLGLNSGTIFG